MTPCAGSDTCVWRRTRGREGALPRARRGGLRPRPPSCSRGDRLPTLARLARDGAFGPLRSTVPAVTPTAWSSFLTGLNPAGHGIFNFSTNPNRGPQRVESAASRAGTPFWRTLAAAGIRSAFVGIPFTYPAEPIDGIVVTGYGGPEQPQILPDAARDRILATHPGLVTAHHPMAERWWEDFERYAGRLVEHVERDRRRLPDRHGARARPPTPLRRLHELRPRRPPRLLTARPGAPRPRPRRRPETSCFAGLRGGRRACGELIEEAAWRYDEEPTAIVLSDHGMKPIYWTFHANRWLEEAGHLRYRRRSLQPPQGRGPERRSRRSTSGSRARTRWYGRAARPRARAAPARRRPRLRRHRLRLDPRLLLRDRRPDLPRRGERGARGPALRGPTRRGARGRSAHPETGEPAFDVLPQGGALPWPVPRQGAGARPPSPRRAHPRRLVRRAWPAAVRASTTRSTRPSFYGYSGHHGLTGILAAAGPGIRSGRVPPGSEIVQLPATLLRLLGLAAQGLDGEPIEEILADSSPGVSTTPAPTRMPERSPTSVYTRRRGAEAGRAPPRPRLRVARRSLFAPARLAAPLGGEGPTRAGTVQWSP